MKTLEKKEERICKYCLISFVEKVEMYRSMAHGYFICQECFKDRQEKKLTI
jgi:superfamily II helicase